MCPIRPDRVGQPRCGREKSLILRLYSEDLPKLGRSRHEQWLLEQLSLKCRRPSASCCRRAHAFRCRRQLCGLGLMYLPRRCSHGHGQHLQAPSAVPGRASPFQRRLWKGPAGSGLATDAMCRNSPLDILHELQESRTPERYRTILPDYNGVVELHAHVVQNLPQLTGHRDIQI